MWSPGKRKRMLRPLFVINVRDLAFSFSVAWYRASFFRSTDPRSDPWGLVFGPFAVWRRRRRGIV